MRLRKYRICLPTAFEMATKLKLLFCLIGMVIVTTIMYKQNIEPQVKGAMNNRFDKLSGKIDSSSRDEQIDQTPNLISPGAEDQQQIDVVCVKNCVTGEPLGVCVNYDSVEDISMLLDTVSKETGEHRMDAFRDIYINGEWSKDTRSGPGSTLEKTQRIRTVLDQVINDIKVALNKTTIDMLDVPCGDLTWMRQFLASRTDISYTGLDIVPELISKHGTEFKSNPGMRFLHKDIASEPLDKPYDLIFSRSMTQHLTTYDTLKVLLTFSQSHSAYLMITNFPISTNYDLDIKALYRYRGQNLEIPPYSLSQPMCQSYDNDHDFMALWRLPLKRVKNCTKEDVLKIVRHHTDFFTCNPHSV